MRTALIATRVMCREQIAEAEPVVVKTDAEIVRPELDAGAWIDFDGRELLAALQGQPRDLRRAALAQELGSPADSRRTPAEASDKRTNQGVAACGVPPMGRSCCAPVAVM